MNVVEDLLRGLSAGGRWERRWGTGEGTEERLEEMGTDGGWGGGEKLGGVTAGGLRDGCDRKNSFDFTT